jgi:hypothetical protein
MHCEAALTDQLSSISRQGDNAYFSFCPRPDQPDRFDQQESFIASKSRGVAWLLGGNGAGTTECCMHKLAKFVLNEQPPPRADTPFWIIAGSYEQVMEACWKEKLYGHGHIPGGEVDWDRVAWYRPKDGWPYRVPLKPWPGRPGKNWTLEFKSYEQGRAQMQARAIGGFCFVEQFPWGIFQEVLRGCREYNFPGSKFCEFTPVDPALSAPLEKMIEEDKLPEGWEIYRANTECAKEAGHISPEWFDEFFGQVPEEMLLVRMTGEFGNYEGTIYQSFSPRIHCAGDEEFDHPPGVHYRRAIDWGSGPDNAFVCLWAYRNGLGEWWIFDEYYSVDQTRTVLDHLDQIDERYEWKVNSPLHGATWADPSSSVCLRMAQSRGMHVLPARNDVLEGIDCVRTNLKIRPGTSQPRLRIHRRNCPNLVHQMKSYRWRPGCRGEPLKENDHAVDALRYLLFSEQINSTGGLMPTYMPQRVDHERYGIPVDMGAFRGRHDQFSTRGEGGRKDKEANFDGQ